MYRVAFLFATAFAIAPSATENLAAPAEFVQVDEVKHMQTSGAAVVEAQTPDPSLEAKPVSIFGLALPIKFIKTADKKSWVFFFDEWSLEVPQYTKYVWPLVIWIVIYFSWLICCSNTDRSGLACRPVFEAACCFVCMWANIATTFRVISRMRAWSYPLLLVLLYTTWSGLDLYFEATKTPQEAKDMESIMFYVFAGLLGAVWIMFSFERMWVRKYFRRLKHPMAADSDTMDFIVSFLCAPFSAMQEAEVVSELKIPEPGEAGEPLTQW